MYNSIYPIQIKPYVPPQTKKEVQNSEDDRQSSKSASSENRENTNRPDANTATDPNGRRNAAYTPQQFPNGQKTTIDYSKSKVNIAQILTDFKNTAIAIGSPPNIIQEVEQYLALAETQSLKNEPNKKIIQSNLKNASNVLDEFISKTLNKKSKVVENWIDALFLQQVDYKSDPETVNPDFLVKLPDKDTGDMKPISQTLSEKAQARTALEASKQQQNENVQNPVQAVEENTKSKSHREIYIPQNEQVKKAFLQGKKYSAINEPKKAISAFKSAIETAHLVGDNKAEGMACYELAKIYDEGDNLKEALKYYNMAHKASDDNNVKARAYYSMAQIYDDVVYFEPAMNHYFAALSFAGEAENLNAQTKTLANIGDMYAERYNIEKTHEFYDTAKNIALETKNPKTMGAIWSRSGDSMTIINENVNALQDYKTSAQFYEEAESPAKMARNYEKASVVMLKLGNKLKAHNLLEKAQKLAIKASDTEYAANLSKQLKNIE